MLRGGVWKCGSRCAASWWSGSFSSLSKRGMGIISLPLTDNSGRVYSTLAELELGVLELRRVVDRSASCPDGWSGDDMWVSSAPGECPVPAGLARAMSWYMLVLATVCIGMLLPMLRRAVAKGETRSVLYQADRGMVVSMCCFVASAAASLLSSYGVVPSATGDPLGGVHRSKTTLSISLSVVALIYLLESSRMFVCDVFLAAGFEILHALTPELAHAANARVAWLSLGVQAAGAVGLTHALVRVGALEPLLGQHEDHQASMIVDGLACWSVWALLVALAFALAHRVAERSRKSLGAATETAALRRRLRRFARQARSLAIFALFAALGGLAVVPGLGLRGMAGTWWYGTACSGMLGFALSMGGTLSAMGRRRRRHVRVVALKPGGAESGGEGEQSDEDDAAQLPWGAGEEAPLGNLEAIGAHALAGGPWWSPSPAQQERKSSAGQQQQGQHLALIIEGVAGKESGKGGADGITSQTPGVGGVQLSPPSRPRKRAASRTSTVLSKLTSAATARFRSSARDNDVPVHARGVSLEFLQQFAKEKGVGGRMTTAEVCQRLLKPITAEASCAYYQLLERAPQSMASGTPRNAREKAERTMKRLVGRSNYFISHSWSYRFRELVSILENFEARMQPTATQYYWFDIFVMNQHSSQEVGGGNLLENLRRSVETPGKLLLCIDSWRDPTPLARCWCLFEMYTAFKAKADIIMAMNQHEEAGFVQQLGTNQREFERMIAEMDARKAEATVAADRTAIFKCIADDIGFDEFNSGIRETLMDSLKHTVMAARNPFQKKGGAAARAARRRRSSLTRQGGRLALLVLSPQALQRGRNRLQSLPARLPETIAADRSTVEQRQQGFEAASAQANGPRSAAPPAIIRDYSSHSLQLMEDISPSRTA